MNEIIHAGATGSAVAVIRTGPEWADIIRNDLSRAVEGIISAGRHLAEAKAEVGHGEWGPLLRGIGISQPYAYRLMTIGERFPNHSSWNDLPRSISTLYELSQLEPDEIEHGMEDGAIHPDITAQDARELRTGSGESSAFDKARKNLRAFEKNASDGLSLPELEQLVTEAEDMFRRIGGPRWKH